MLDVEQFLDEHKRKIVDFVQPKNIFDMLVNALAEQIPLGRDGLKLEDKPHKELAVAMIHSMWCGWLSQAKRNMSVYIRYVDSFQTIYNPSV
jgi:hypothetical protein